MVNGDSVQKLGPNISFEGRRPVLDQPQAEVDVAEQAALVGLPEARRRTELAGSAEVVQQRGRQEQIGRASCRERV